MRNINFISSGDAEEDAEFAARVQESYRRRDLGMCPNGCPGFMKLKSPTHRECQFCGFGDFSNTPWPTPPSNDN